MEGALLKETTVSFKYFYFLLLLAFVSSCAKLNYVWEQGIGQLAIQWSAKDNQKILDDPNVDEKVKLKILAIINAKAFFEKTYNVKLDDIYEKTTFLNREAVSYMVTASPVDKIEPYRVSFPLVGEFPYLAFFKKKSALKFAQKLQKKKLVTWLRPVHAYSSLNYFDDRILSSFFVFDEKELAELVFHELTHLTVFVKNDVGFNESLAQFIAHKTLEVYFHGKAEQFLSQRKASRRLSKDLVPMIKKLNRLYSEDKDQDPNELRKSLLKNEVFPRFQIYCREINRKCQLKEENWNNARMVGYLNYEQTYERVENIYKKQTRENREHKNKIINFVKFLTTKYKAFRKTKERKMKFLDFLEKTNE